MEPCPKGCGISLFILIVLVIMMIVISIKTGLDIYYYSRLHNNQRSTVSSVVSSGFAMTMFIVSIIVLVLAIIFTIYFIIRMVAGQERVAIVTETLASEQGLIEYKPARRAVVERETVRANVPVRPATVAVERPSLPAHNITVEPVTEARPQGIRELRGGAFRPVRSDD